MNGKENIRMHSLMQKVWLDNSLVSGSQETLLLAKEIIKGAAASEELLRELDLAQGERRALLQEWQEKVQALDKLVGSLQQVQALARRELQILLSDK